jgi:hypothetical protein
MSSDIVSLFEESFNNEKEQFIDNIPKDSKDIKKAFKVEQHLQGVYVWAVAIHRDYEANGRINIPTEYGTPLTPEVHDTIKDFYYIEGVGIHQLGYIPINYCLTMEESDFEIFIPLPFSVIKRYITEEQKKLFFNWKTEFQGNEFYFRFFQVMESF